jgi:hypothetical protein
VNALAICMSALTGLSHALRRAGSPAVSVVPGVRFPWFVRLLCLLSRGNTRYGWLVRPYPVGTSTPQETPSFAWRTNARLQAPPIAAARHERRLFPVGCKPFIGRVSCFQ